MILCLAPIPGEGEVSLYTLSPGTEFAMPIGDTDDFVFGKVLEQWMGCTLVELPSGKHETWPLETPVVDLTPEPDNEEDDMAAKVADEKVRQNILARFKFQCSRLLGGTEEEVAQAKLMIPRIVKNATEANFQLPAPSVLGIEGIDDNPVFAGVEFDFTPAESTVPVTGQAKSSKKNVKKEKAVAAAAEAKATGTAGIKAPKTAKVKSAPHPCICGCETLVQGRFAPGHDAKLKSLIYKIERGEAAPEAIGGEAAKLVKFDPNGNDNVGGVVRQLYKCTAAPVRIPNRPEVEFV